MRSLLSVSSLCLLVASTGLAACEPARSEKVVPDGGDAGGTSRGDTGGTASSGGTVGTAGTPGTGGTGGITGTGGAGVTGGTPASGWGGSTNAGGAVGTGGGSTGTAGSGAGDGIGGSAASGGEENKIVLFDGSAATFDGWFAPLRPTAGNPWRNNGDGTMTVVTGTGNIQSKMKFQDLFVHVEYMTPLVQAPDLSATRDSSGILLKGSYEMQIVDSYGQPPAIDGCGAVHDVRPPSLTACLPGGQWNTYDIEFKASVCDAQGGMTATARIVKATLNGTVVQQDVELPQMTKYGQPESCDPAGLVLQDGASLKPVTYRNIWVVPRVRP